MKRKWIRWLVAAGLLGGLYVGLAAWLLYRGPLEPRTGFSTGSANAAWLAHRWFDDHDRKPIEPGEPARLAARCRDAGIRDLFLHVGPLDSQGGIPPWEPERWRPVRDELRRLLPGVRLLAWLGAPNADFEGVAEDTLDLTREGARNGVVMTAVDLLGEGFDGIHYDIEPIRNGDDHFLQLLEATRARVEVLSVATPHMRPTLVPPVVPFERQWTADYYREVASRCDQVVYMGYDTGQPDEERYSRWIRWQARAIGPLVPGQFVVGVPTYDEEQTLWHNPRAETLSAAFRGLTAAGAPDSVAVYAEWTTTAPEWEELSRWRSGGSRSH
ncbi:MAG: glycoside hydrolase family 18 protein [Candidatus Eremiobacterota bacterium]